MIKTLSRDTICTKFEIKEPQWNGGKPLVGLDVSRLSKHNEIHILYKRKDGSLSFPDVYYLDGDSLRYKTYKNKNIGFTTLVLVPIADFDILERQ